jgi:hypothetical protein
MCLHKFNNIVYRFCLHSEFDQTAMPYYNISEQTIIRCFCDRTGMCCSRDRKCISPVNTNKLFRVHLEMHYSGEREQRVFLEKSKQKHATRSSEKHVTSCNITRKGSIYVFKHFLRMKANKLLHVTLSILFA